MFYWSSTVSMFRLSEGLCREDWTSEEIHAISMPGDLRQRLGVIEEQLWFPKPMELFQYLFDPDLPESQCQDIRFHLEKLGCARSMRMMKVLQNDSGMDLLKDLSHNKQMKVLGHMAISKTWMTPVSDPRELTLEKSLPGRQAHGDASRNIILDNYPVRVKRSIGVHGGKTSLIFPGKTYPFPKVKVIALDEHFQVLMEEDLTLDPGARFWMARFKTPTARKYLLAVRPLDPSEASLENQPGC